MYKFRDYPSNIVPDDKLWCIVGKAVRTKMDWVLEWCHDSADASQLLSHMQSFPDSFTQFESLTAMAYYDFATD